MLKFIKKKKKNFFYFFYMLLILLNFLYFPGGISNNNLILWLDSSNFTSYPLNGNKWYDLSTNNNHGDILSTVTYSSYFNSSFSFTGIGEITLPSLFSTYPFTISILCTHNNEWISNSGSQQFMTLTINSVRIGLYIYSNSIWICYGGSSHWYILERPNLIGKNDWHNIIWRVNNQNNHKIHLDDLITTNIDNGGTCGGDPGWSIGSNSLSNSWDENYRGNISEIIIYKRYLLITESRILNVYTNSKKNSFLNTNLFNINKSIGFNYQIIGIGRESLNDYILNSIYSSGGLILESLLDNNYFLNFIGNYLIVGNNNHSYEFLNNNIFNKKWYFTKTLLNNSNGILNLKFLNFKNNLNINLIFSENSNFNNFQIISKNISLNNLLIFNINSNLLNNGFYTLLLLNNSKNNLHSNFFQFVYFILLFFFFI